MSRFSDKEILENLKHIEVEQEVEENPEIIEILFTLKSKYHHKTTVNQIRKSLKKVKKYLENAEEIESYSLSFELTKEGNIHYHAVCSITSYIELCKAEYATGIGFIFLKQLESRQHEENAYQYLIKVDDNGYHAVQKKVFGQVIYMRPITKCSQLNYLIKKVREISIADKPKKKSIHKYHNRSSTEE